jgi:PAT family beta-lactamase induction signal transducer AmpG
MSSDNNAKSFSPWGFVPSLYFAEGVPYLVVTGVAMIVWKNFGVDNATITFWTSLLNLPWVLKPLWSPLLELYSTKRQWILRMQVLLGLTFGLLALGLHGVSFFWVTLLILFGIAFLSATHDIAADGFYILALPERTQALFVGVRSTFYRLSMLSCQGFLVMAAGFLGKETGNIPLGWSMMFVGLAILFLGFALYHWFFLPYPSSDRPSQLTKIPFKEVVLSFFAKPEIGWMLAFLLLYRFGEVQLLAVSNLFLLDPMDKGGLELSVEALAFGHGTLGIIAMLVGGILGGLLIAKAGGLKPWFYFFWACINIPDLVYVFMAWAQPKSLYLIWSLIAVEQFGYGLGFSAYMLYMIYIAGQNQWTVSHYALCTGFMALGRMIPGTWSGYLQQHLGYTTFFLWVCLCTLPALFIIRRMPLDPNFGTKN